MAGNSKPTIHFDEFVQAARPNPKEKNPLVFMQGYIGKSPVNGCVRVYTDPSLNNYFDIPSADIAHSQKVSDDPLGLGGSQLWIKLPTSDNKVAGTYLEGNLYDDFLKNKFGPPNPQPGKPGTGVFATDITKPTDTLATDITKPAATDITKVLITDFTKVRDLVMTRYIRVATRACPPWDFRPGSNLSEGPGAGYYY